MYILLEYTRIIEPLSQCFDTQTIVIIIHRGRDVKILLLTILLDIVFKTMKINKIHYKVSKYHSTPKSNRIPKGYIYLSNGWITVDKILTFTIIFVAIFVIIWLCIYIPIRIKIARINKIFSK